MQVWNPWHGCRKYSPGCANCYVYRRDESIGKDASVVTKTRDYDLPRKKNRQGEPKLRADGGTVFTCMTSDFFLEQADAWRQGCWEQIRERQDLHFYIITKRIDRAAQCLPPDWGDGWEHVTLCATCEDQERADERLPVLLRLPLRHREVICEPLLGKIQIEPALATGLIERVSCGGESGDHARKCDFRWVQELRRECIRCGIQFTFRQTGAVFVKDGKVYHIDRRLQIAQAEKSGYSYTPGTGCADAIRYRLPDLSSHVSGMLASPFRSSFHLSDSDRAYIAEKGMDTIRRHAQDFVAKRLAPENPANDGRQTPMKGHPVFLAQHANACCCRSCLEQWHHIPAGKILTPAEQAYIVDLLMAWIEREYNTPR